MNKKDLLLKIKSIVQSILGIRWVRYTYQYMNIGLLTVVSKSGILSAIYGSFLSGAFLREQQGVVQGRLIFFKRAVSEQVNLVALRRNIHRLEKGMTMRPARPVFAAEYIGETVDELYKLLSTEAQLEKPDFKWAFDVLSKYFSIIGHHPKIDAARERFNKVKDSITLLSQAEAQFIPYERAASADVSIAYEEFYKLTKTRRSIRWFLDQKVERELIDKALLAAVEAPSACNRQPFEFRIFDEPERVVDIASTPFGTLGYAQNIPVIAVLVGKLDSYSSARDRHVIYIDAALAAMGFMYALETLGLSSCPINWPDFEPLEKKMARKLGLSKYERPIMLIAIGYADPKGMVAYSSKKSLDDLRRYN